MHQRKPIVTDTRSKKISNTLQVNEADSFGIKSTPHRKYNKVSSQRAKTHCNPIYPFSSPYIYIYKSNKVSSFHFVSYSSEKHRPKNGNEWKSFTSDIPLLALLEWKEENIYPSNEKSRKSTVVSKPWSVPFLAEELLPHVLGDISEHFGGLLFRLARKI